MFILIFAVGCAAKSSDPLGFETGFPTLNNLSRGELNLACADAKALKELFLSYDGITFSVATLQIVEPDKVIKYGFDDNEYYKSVSTEYKNIEERILIPFKSNPDAYAKVLNTVINSDISGVFTASFYNYLGLMTQIQVDKYINVIFCGGRPDVDFMSPTDIPKEQFTQAVNLKVRYLKNKIKE